MTINRLAQLSSHSGMVSHVTSTGAVHAAPLTPSVLTGLQILQQFNLVDFTNFSTNSDVEGRAVIGGDLTSSNSSTFFNNQPGGSGNQNAPASTFQALTVYGNVTNAININMNSGGSAYIGGSVNSGAHFNFNGGGSRVATTPTQSIADFKTAAFSLESQLANLSTSGTVNASDFNNVTLTGGGGSTAVFSISASALQTWHGMSLNLNGATSVIINVTGGTNINLTNGLNLNNGFTSHQHDIIWNFETATSVSVTGWQGAILAVDATVSNTSAVNGAVIANAFVGSGELHQYVYDGVVCFLAGTRIATPDGEANIEDLAIGDFVMTHDGRSAPVRWVGRQTVEMARAVALRVLPIRIKAGALCDMTPARDLLVSTCHALMIDGLLIQAGALVNGTSIVREYDVPETFTYYHVELDGHFLILAEGVAAETFIDNVGRMAFDNWDEHEAMFPGGRALEEIDLPRVQSARQLPSLLRQYLDDRAVQFDEQMLEAA